MKKYLLFAVAALLAFTVNAATPYSQVTLHANKNYDVVIDGQTYRGYTTIPMSSGYHSVQVYTRGGFIIKRRSLVSSSSFNLRNNDVLIDVDQNGQARIYSNNSYGNNNRYGNDGDRNYGRNRNRGDNNGWGPYDNPGRGHKYGLYKNKKNRDRDGDYDND